MAKTALATEFAHGAKQEGRQCSGSNVLGLQANHPTRPGGRLFFAVRVDTS